ncbi:MAG: DEAD/DEAH box helicase [Clostridia bacterium]|nr:DEAD/DEAH box helicase [Clostridia bacterium]
MLTCKTTMMRHQQTAVNKLSRVKVGALYCDMGTGKTLTALELAVKRLNAGKVDCILWCCPVSVRQTIADEVDKHVTGATWEIVQPRAIRNPHAHIYIAGIEGLSSSISLNARLMELVEAKRCFLVCDESSLIKNHMANRTLALWRLAERCQYKLILNGTPLSNNEQDLYSQWYFLDPRILGYNSYYSFAANHLEFDPDYPQRVVAAHDVELLTRKIQPYTYQVRKHECLDLPPKSYGSRYCYMGMEQRALYEVTRDRMLAEMEYENPKPHTIYRLFTALQRIMSGVWLDRKTLFPDPMDNPRVRVLLDTIEELPRDSKCILWCKYTHEIETLQRILESRGGVAVLHGGIQPKHRDQELRRFRENARFLVANKRVGAFGLNLQHCNYAIYYSNDFSWETRSQSEDRIHRAGQTRNCHILDIVCSDSIDEQIHRCLRRKENLVDAFRKQIDRTKDKMELGRWIDGAKDDNISVLAS